MNDFELITKKLNDLYKAKNSDYGNSFNKTMDEFGMIAALIRLGDKLNRLKSLNKCGSTGKVEDESIDDTLMDLANYAIMTILWRNSK